MSPPRSEPPILDAIVVGAGFAGMYMLYRLRQMGFRTHVLETGGDVGGTWYWNRYPGARCDAESLFYSYSFSPELEQAWTWSERYATQPEIMAYANHVADRFDLRRDITFDSKVIAATVEETTGLWTVETDRGMRLRARYCIMATGNLSTANLPDLPGIATFKGPIHHTGRWPHESVDFTGQHVAVIGTGSSAMQSLPLIAEHARHVTVLQRTAAYAVPAWNQPLDAETVRDVKADYPALREKLRWTFSHNMFEVGTMRTMEVSPAEREAVYEARWRVGGLGFLSGFTDVQFSDEANDVAANFVRRKIREVVRDPAVAELLTPKIIIGCKRLCVVTDYYETFNRPNVSLVDISRTPIAGIKPDGLEVDGKFHPADMLVMATGFDAMTGTLLRIDIRTTDGKTLRDKWQDGPACYLGLAMAGLPNLFIITGPGSPSVFTNMLPSIEHHADFIADCLGYMRDKGYCRIEAKHGAEQAWVAHVGEVANRSLRPSCNSWYVGANIEGKPRVFMPYMGGVPAYRRACEDVVAKGYDGFALA